MPRDLSRLAYERGTSSITPSGKGAITSGAVLIGGEAVAAELEVVVDRSVSGEELLRLPGWVETPHVAFALSGRLVRDLTAVVQIPALPMFNLSKAEAEAVIQPDRLVDNLGRKAEAAVRIGCRAHARDPATDPELSPS